MKRKTFGVLLAAAGAVLVLALGAAGGFAMWTYDMTHSNVHDELAREQLYFPNKGSSALNNPRIKAGIVEFEGKQVLNGPQARAYADTILEARLSQLPYRGVYSQAQSAEAANPNDATLQRQTAEIFQFSNLRQSLLNDYAMWRQGEIAFWVGITAFCLAFFMLVCLAAGIVIARRTPSPAAVLDK